MPDLDLRAARLRAEREVLQAALARSNNTLATAARLLGVSRPTLYGLMEAHGIDAEGMKPPSTTADAQAVRAETAKTE
jgi:two-component system NtrC family response regulator